MPFKDKNKARAAIQAWRDKNPDYDRTAYKKHKIRCNAASRRANLKKRFNMTIEEYDALSAAQDHVCAICNGVNSNGRRLAVDHDHHTEKRRGLLCFNCNTSLGKFNDDLDLLKQAVAYLEKYKD